jgi:hypothetical protein
MTVVTPYTARTLAAPATLVPGTTAQLAWTPSTDTFAPPTTIKCYTPDPSGAPVPVNVIEASMTPAATDVLLTYRDGVLSFPVPSSVSYRGSLPCFLLWNVNAEIDACTNIASCSAMGPLPAMTFAVSI